MASRLLQQATQDKERRRLKKAADADRDPADLDIGAPTWDGPTHGTGQPASEDASGEEGDKASDSASENAGGEASTTASADTSAAASENAGGEASTSANGNASNSASGEEGDKASDSASENAGGEASTTASENASEDTASGKAGDAGPHQGTAADGPGLARSHRRRGRPRGPERVKLSVRITAELDEQLSRAVDKTSLSPQYLVEEALTKYFRSLGIKPGR